MGRKPCDVCTVSSCDGWPDDDLVSANYEEEECRAACSSVIHEFVRDRLSVPGPIHFTPKPLAQPDTKIFSLQRDYGEPLFGLVTKSISPIEPLEREVITLDVEQAKVVLNRPPRPPKPGPLRARDIDGGDFSFLIWIALGVSIVVTVWFLSPYFG